MPNSPNSTVTLTLANGARIKVDRVISHRIRGLDADGDLLLCDQTIRSQDGAEYLVPLTRCCRATGKGADSATGVVCRNCYRVVHSKYGGPGRIAVGLAATVSTVSRDGRLLTLTATASDGPSTLILAGASCGDGRELRERVTAAMRNSGLPVVHRRTTVRADPPRALSTATAAAVAVAAVAAAAEISTRRLAGVVVLGDVGLDGTLRLVDAVLPAAKAAHAHGDVVRVIVPVAGLAEMEFGDGFDVLGAYGLADVAAWMRGDDGALATATATS